MLNQENIKLHSSPLIYFDMWNVSQSYLIFEVTQGYSFQFTLSGLGKWKKLGEKQANSRNFVNAKINPLKVVVFKTITKHDW